MSRTKQNKETKTNTTISKKEKNLKTASHLKIKLVAFFVLLVFLLVQIISFIYYITRIGNYESIVRYSYYKMQIIRNFVLPYLAIREFIIDQNKTFKNVPVKTFLEKALRDVYADNSLFIESKNKYSGSLPDEFLAKEAKSLQVGVCDLIKTFMFKFPSEVNNHTSCEYFYYNTSSYGFNSILTAFFEDIRMLKDYINQKLVKLDEINEKYGVQIAFREMYYNTEYYQMYNVCAKYEEYCNITKDLNPTTVLKMNNHKRLLIVFRYILSNLMEDNLSGLSEAVRGEFDKTNTFSILINIIFMVVVFVGFVMIYLPFVFRENETIYKTKNMLSIIPKEILVTLPYINVMLGLDKDKK